MKPSERRALEAEKRARQAAEFRERELQKEARVAEKRDKKTKPTLPEAPVEDYTAKINEDATYKKLPEGEIEVKGDGIHREGFFSNHARLIAFIITAALVLFVLGPLGVDMLVAHSRSSWNGNEKGGDKTMTVTDLVALSQKGENIEWDDLDGYKYTDNSYTKEKKTTYNHKYDIAESNDLCLEVIGSDDSDKPEIVRLIDYNSGAFIDIRTTNVSEFLAKHGYIAKLEGN